MRGKYGLLEDILVQNFMLIFGAKPGVGVKSDTKLIHDVMSCFQKFYEKLTQTVMIPTVLNCLQGSDTNIEIVQSSML